MDKSFASVEWLSQSSRKDTMDYKTSSSSPRDLYSWNPVMRPLTKIAQVSPYPGTQRPTYPESNYASPCLWDTNQAFKSSDYEVSHYRMESPRLPGFTEPSQKDLETSHSPICSGQYASSDNSTSSQDIPTSTEKVYESQAEKTNEDCTNSGCISSNESGYDSETSRSGSTTPVQSVAEESSDEEGKLGRRLRTAFTTEQITTLESTFQKHRYLGASERRKLAAKLQLSEVQIKTWFQNRRMKHKREIQEGRQGQFHPGQFYSVYGYPAQALPSFQYMQPGHQYYADTPLVESMPASYPSPPPALDCLNSFSSPSISLMYLPQQPHVHQHEQQFVRY